MTFPAHCHSQRMPCHIMITKWAFGGKCCYRTTTDTGCFHATLNPKGHSVAVIMTITTQPPYAMPQYDIKRHWVASVAAKLAEPLDAHLKSQKGIL